MSLSHNAGMKRIYAHEWLFPLGLAASVFALGSLPYLYGYWTCGEDEVFMGFVGRGTNAASSYFAFSRQVVEGHTLMTNLYTPEPCPRIYFHPEWWFIGWFARTTGLSLTTVFHIERGTAVLAFFAAIYYLLAAVFVQRSERRAVTLLVVFGAGLGWVVYGTNFTFGATLDWPLDLKGVTIFGYLINKPHFIRAGIFAALFAGFFIRGVCADRSRYFILAGLAGTAHGIMRPFHIADTLLFLLAYPFLFSIHQRALDGRACRNSALALGFFLPTIAWYTYIGLTNPLGLSPAAFRQAELLLRNVLWLGLPLAAILIHVSLRGLDSMTNAPKESILIGIWLAVSMAVINAFPYYKWAHESFFPFVLAPPILFARHTWPVLCQTAARVCSSRLTKPALVAFVVIAVIPSNVFVYAKFFYDLHHPDPPWQYYLPKPVLESIGWLQDNAPAESVILASHDTTQFIPRFADLKVVTGQDVMTVNYAWNNENVSRFFASSGDDGFKRWLCTLWGVDYILYGPAERHPNGCHPEDYPWMTPVFDSGDAKVYRVNPN